MSPTSYQTAPSRDNIMALRVGLEPTTYRLTAGCSTIELPKRKTHKRFNYFVWRFPSLPGGCPPSTIGVMRLNFCVRYGNRCIPHAIVTILFSGFLVSREVALRVPSALLGLTSVFGMETGVSLALSPLYFLNLLNSNKYFQSRVKVLVSISLIHYCTYTLDLSKVFSLPTLRNLILRPASYLDAFSTYQFHT